MKDGEKVEKIERRSKDGEKKEGGRRKVEGEGGRWRKVKEGR